MSEHVRYWDHISPTSQTRLADDVVDAILRDVFQGKKDHLRDHARAVAYKAVRGHEWPYFEECVEKAVADRLAAGIEVEAPDDVSYQDAYEWRVAKPSKTNCEAGHPVQSCQGCDAGNCAMLHGFTPDAEEPS